VGEGAGDVFMTDDVLATLMCAPRSTYPWDVVITKRGGVLLFDKRANSSLDYLTVRGWWAAGAWRPWGAHAWAWSELAGWLAS
jgi:hypothetical protein